MVKANTGDAACRELRCNETALAAANATANGTAEGTPWLHNSGCSTCSRPPQSERRTCETTNQPVAQRHQLLLEWLRGQEARHVCGGSEHSGHSVWALSVGTQCGHSVWALMGTQLSTGLEWLIGGGWSP